DTSDVMEDSMDQIFEADTDEIEVDKLLQEYGTEIGLSAEEGLPMPSSQSSELEAEIAELRKEEE
ncbi:MAG: hypothetical protein KAJ00_08005, partial [Deltaproteobacteria bacterium]|nr:hypothetical protein [Deltaproteobacteria bacterium]